MVVVDDVRVAVVFGTLSIGTMANRIKTATLTELAAPSAGMCVCVCVQTSSMKVTGSSLCVNLRHNLQDVLLVSSGCEDRYGIDCKPNSFCWPAVMGMKQTKHLGWLRLAAGHLPTPTTEVPAIRLTVNQRPHQVLIVLGSKIRLLVASVAIGTACGHVSSALTHDIVRNR